MKRRNFLAIAGSSTVGFTVGQLGLDALWASRRRDLLARRTSQGARHEHERVSVCGGCAAGCSVLVRVIDGNAVTVRGNPRCPVGQGGLCPRGVSEVEALYDPDRIVGPIQRLPRAGGAWGRVEWDDALGTVAERIAGLVARGRGDAVAAVLSGARGATSEVVHRILGRLGSPHAYHVAPQRDASAAAFGRMALGTEDSYGFDLGSVDLILSFGTPLLEGWLAPTYVTRCFGAGRLRDRDELRLAHVASRLSPTAMHADEWIACAPGTEPLVALAVASTTLKEGWADPVALERLIGFAPWTDLDGARHPGFRDALLADYNAEAVTERVGVSVETIHRLALAFSRARAPVAIAERTGASAGVFGLAAGHLLNAITGRVGREGAMIVPSAAPVGALSNAPAPPQVRLDEPPFVSVAGTPIWRALGGLHRAGAEPPFEVLFLEDGAALDDVTPGDPAYELLKRVPLVVSLATGLDASTEVADLVLPATTNFEQTVDVQTPAIGGFTAVAAARPAVPPLVDGRPIADVFLDLGRRLGVPLAFEAVDEVVRHRLVGLRMSGRGTGYTEPGRRGEAADGALPGADASFVDAVFASGGWVEHDARRRATPIHYAVDGRHYTDRTVAPTLFALPDTDVAWLPHPEGELTRTRDDDMFVLELVAVAGLCGSGTPNRPSLLQAAAPYIGAAFGPWAELSPTDAERLQLRSGTAVRVSSSSGELTLPLKINPGVRPGTVAIPWAPWARGSGRYARLWTAAAEHLAASVFSPAGSRVAAGLAVQLRAEAST